VAGGGGIAGQVNVATAVAEVTSTLPLLDDLHRPEQAADSVGGWTNGIIEGAEVTDSGLPAAPRNGLGSRSTPGGTGNGGLSSTLRALKHRNFQLFFGGQLVSVTGTWVQVWHILVLAGSLGVANAFDIPARQAFLVDMVGREDLMNAIALNSSMFNGARSCCFSGSSAWWPCPTRCFWCPSGSA
jgi:hypothetical protein